MSLRSRCAAWASGLARRRRMESDMEAEMRAHIEACVEDQVRAGVPRPEAERTARVEFGSVESLKEECREARGWRILDELAQDARYAVRVLRRTPGFTAVAVLTLGVGLGANTAIFSAVDAWILRPLPFPHPERLMAVWSVNTKRGDALPVAAGDLADFRGPNPFFEDIAGWRKTTLTWTRDGAPEQIDGARASSAFFRVLGVAPALGRDFQSEDDAPGARGVALLTDRLWRARFAADPRIVGSPILLNGAPVTVIGILPPEFQFTLVGAADIWMPLALPASQALARNGGGLRAVARLKPGVDARQARPYLASVARELERAWPATNARRGVDLQPLREAIDEDIRSDAILTLFAIGGCVLLIACANVASLMVGRAASRRPEFAVRLAIGAGRPRLARQLLTETIVLFLAGAALAVAVAQWGATRLSGWVPAEIRGYLPHAGVLRVDFRSLAYAFGVALAAAAVFGLAAAAQCVRGSLSRGRTAPPGAGLRKTLVAGEVALAVVVLVASGLLLKSLLRISRVDPGFRSDRLLTARVSLSSRDYQDPGRVREFYRAALERAARAPGVRAVGAAQYIPFGLINGTTGYQREDRPAPPPGEAHWAEYAAATPGYRAALDLPLVRGRWIAAEDRADSTPVVVVNETLARTEWPGEEPLGRRIRLAGLARPLTVVGVVHDVKIIDLREPREPQLYVPFEQAPAAAMTFVARVEGEAAAELRRAVAEVDPSQAVFDIESMEQRMLTSHIESTIAARLMSVFAAIAVFLAAIGIYGVLAYSVAMRRREIGVRLAVGASRRDVARMVLRQALQLTAAGVAAGLACALAAARLLAALLYQVSSRDFTTLAVVTAAVAAVASIAAYAPARRAARIDPAAALRVE